MERLPHLARRRPPILGTLRERLHHDVREPTRHARPPRLGASDLGLAHLVEERRDVGVLVEHPTGEQLVEHDAGREDVAAVIHRIAPRLLGAHVVVLALDHAGFGLRRAGRRLRDAEVHDLHLARGADEHVLRRDVAVDDVERLPGVRVALAMGVVEAVAHLGDHEGRDVDGDRLLELRAATHDAVGVRALDELHRDVVGVLDLPEIEGLRDVHVREEHRDLGLLHEHLREVLVLGEARVDHLERDELLEARHAPGLRDVHLGHAAHGDAPQQCVVSEGLREIVRVEGQVPAPPGTAAGGIRAA
ncbi:MAG: hypothetical protein U0353_20865 [Sandaracinus sp.]